MLGDPRTIEPSVDLILISGHIERVGDHATKIAQDVIFLVGARDVRHRAGPTAPNRADRETFVEREDSPGPTVVSKIALVSQDVAEAHVPRAANVPRYPLRHAAA